MLVPRPSAPPSRPHSGATITTLDQRLRQVSSAHEATKSLLSQLIDEQQPEHQRELWQMQQNPKQYPLSGEGWRRVLHDANFNTTARVSIMYHTAFKGDDPAPRPEVPLPTHPPL